MTKHQEKLRQYILHQLSEEEAIAFELELLASPTCNEDFNLVEDLLLDDYLEGQLTETEHQRFAEHIQLNKHLQVNEQPTKLLTRYAKKEGK
ncbi:MAG: hypothetical protein JST84_05300 [Acidobacteria bacterium]|nr:hypothetical protein [Acidobacteriota bacterium]